MANILDVAAGIKNYQDDEDKRAQQAFLNKLAQAKIDEEVRSHTADEGLRRDTNTESMAFRRIQQQQLNDTRSAAAQDRDDARTMRGVVFRKIGAPVTESEMSREMSAGVPSAAYKPGEWQGGTLSDSTDPGADQGPTRSRDISWTGTQAQEDSQQRLADAASREAEARRYHDLQNENTDLSRNLAQSREDRIRGWGPPTVIIADPNNPGRNIITTRAGGVGQEAPAPGAVQTQAINNDVSTNQLDRLEKMFDEGASSGVGPYTGRANTFRQIVPGMDTNAQFNDFAAASNAFKNSVIKAITGAQMSEKEATRIQGQIPLVTDKSEVWKAKAAQTRKNLQDLSSVMTQKGGGGGAPAPRRIRYDINGNPLP